MAQAGECFVKYEGNCKPGYTRFSGNGGNSRSEGRIHDFDGPVLGTAKAGDLHGNRHSWPKCSAAATTLANACFNSKNPGKVTTWWVRWGQRYAYGPAEVKA